MTETRYTLRPTLRAALLTFLIHHNPFYLLSALCMVAGCFALNSGLSPRAGELPKLLALLATLNVYEAILIALGLYLIRRRGILRDGRTLLLIQAPFLFDLMFLNAEAGSVNLRDGAMIDAIAFLLALVKVGIVLRVLYGRWPGRALVFTAASLAAMFFLPAVFKWIEGGGMVTAIHFYAAWWIVGLLLILWEVLGRFASDGPMPSDEGVARTMRRLYTALPLLSLAAHLGMLHWVYLVSYSAADLTPVLLGLTVAMGCLPAKSDARPLRAVLPALAFFLSLSDPSLFSVQIAGRLHLTPVLLTIASAYLVYVYSFFLARALYLITAAVLMGIAIEFGPTLTQMANALDAMWEWAWARAQGLLPRTALQWGIAAMVASFGFLGIGAAVSLRKQSPPVVVETETGAG